MVTLQFENLLMSFFESLKIQQRGKNRTAGWHHTKAESNGCDGAKPEALYTFENGTNCQHLMNRTAKHQNSCWKESPRVSKNRDVVIENLDWLKMKFLKNFPVLCANDLFECDSDFYSVRVNHTAATLNKICLLCSDSKYWECNNQGIRPSRIFLLVHDHDLSSKM